MTYRSVPVSCVMVVASVLPSPCASAECVTVPAKQMAKQVMEEKRYELVFSGIVVAVTRTTDLGYRATFDVDRVWKGTVTKQFDLYVWESAAEIPKFETGRHYLALARKLLTPQERKGAGLDGDTVAFTPVQCSDPLSLAPGLIRELGPGRAPTASANPE